MKCDRPVQLGALAAATAALVIGASVLLVPGAEAEEQPEADDAESEREDVQQIPAADEVSVVYQGVLQNEEGEPVGGVFPLTFHLYRGSMSADPLWTEQHYVSVVDGRYQVTLGEQSPLREHLLAGERWLGVELDGQQELLRDQILVDRPDRADDADGEADERITHADVAERATEAERARFAETAASLDGLTADDVEHKAELALERLGDHIADPNAHDAVAGPAVGEGTQRAGDEVGGTGGTSYEMHCPDGYVVTGIEGGAGRVVDSITLLCSPLE